MSRDAFFDQDALNGFADALASACPVMAAARQAPLSPWRRRRADFEGLAQAIAYQQLAGAAADAIWGRVRVALDPMTPEAFLAAGEETLRGCGLSRPKIRHITAVAEATRSGALDFAALEQASEETARETLTAVRGVGPWTADIFLMSAHGRLDVFPSGDLGLQAGYQRAAGLKERPKPKELAAQAETWAPTRSVAALMLWSYLDESKAQERAAP